MFDRVQPTVCWMSSQAFVSLLLPPFLSVLMPYRSTRPSSIFSFTLSSSCKKTVPQIQCHSNATNTHSKHCTNHDNLTRRVCPEMTLWSWQDAQIRLLMEPCNCHLKLQSAAPLLLNHTTFDRVQPAVVYHAATLHFDMETTFKVKNNYWSYITYCSKTHCIALIHGAATFCWYCKV